MNNTDVLIVGAGPSGLTLAASLVSRGIATTVVDRQAAGANTSRAAVINARSLEVLEDLDVARRVTDLRAWTTAWQAEDRRLHQRVVGLNPHRRADLLLGSQIGTG